MNSTIELLEDGSIEYRVDKVHITWRKSDVDHVLLKKYKCSVNELIETLKTECDQRHLKRIESGFYNKITQDAKR